MNKKHNIFLAGIHQATGFKDWLDDVESGQPTLPLFDPNGENHPNSWAYFSGLREGYRLAISKLGVQLDE